MLEQMGDAGLANGFMTRSDSEEGIIADDRQGMIFQSQNLKAVTQFMPLDIESQRYGLGGYGCSDAEDKEKSCECGVRSAECGV